MTDYEPKDPFIKELSALLNRHGMDKMTSTPDHILANYLNDCLTAHGRAKDYQRIWEGNS